MKQIAGARRKGLIEPGPRASAVTPSRRRGDIQGLRAILMTQVLLFHAWTVGSPIGIDSFITVSAFLMTSSFLRRSEAGHMPFFIERWGNTFKRLMPPLVLVVLATLGASLTILSPARWKEITVQAFASITYWQNWRLVEVAADYYADDHALSSPLQHLWSMSMQGQIFLLWPLLMTLCVLIARRLNWNARGLVTAFFAAIAVASLVWLLYFSPADGSVYFDTRSRIWEFALGSMAAACAPWLKLPQRITRLFVYLAFVVLVVYCLVSIGNYPGPMAAVPILCVSVLLVFMPRVSGNRVDRILSLRPLVGMGNISYAVYLVHWPIFVLYLAVVDAPSLGFADGSVLIGVSILFGWLLTRFVDDPLRHLPWANRSTVNKYKVVAICLVVGLVPVAGVYYWLDDRAKEIEETERSEQADYAQVDEIDLTSLIPEAGPGSDANPGARILLGDAQADFEGVPLIPDAQKARAMPHYEGECPPVLRNLLGEKQSKFCSTRGDLSLAQKRVLVAGSSHAQQLLTWQIPPLVDSQGWAAVSILSPGCAWTAPGYLNDDCSDRNQAVLDYVDMYHPDYVFLIVTYSHADSPDETLISGVVELVEDLTDQGITVIGVSDNLRSEESLFDCSDQRPDDEPYGGCLVPEEEHFGDQDFLDPLLSIDGYHHVDMRDAYCVDGVCPTIIGNVMVYFDSNHVTTAYARSVAPFFSQRVLDIVRATEETFSRDVP